MLGTVYESETEKAKSLTFKCIESGKKISDDVNINFSEIKFYDASKASL